MNGFAAALMAAGAVNTAIPPTPPDTPQRGEVIIDGARDPVAIGCMLDFSRSNKSLHRILHRVVVTKDPKWGTIWRADSSFPASHGYAPMWWRTVCSKESILERPLKMFDPSQSIGRLK